MHVSLWKCGEWGGDLATIFETQNWRHSLCVKAADQEGSGKYFLLSYKLILGEELIIQFFSDNKEW